MHATLLTLTTAMAEGDDEAWQTFHHELGPVISRYLLVATRGDAHLADEAMQQTYLKIARRVPRTADQVYFKNWTLAVARNTLVDLRRRQRRYRLLLLRRRDDPTDASIALPDRSVDPASIDSLLETCLQALPPEISDLLKAKYYQGRTVQELARSLSTSPKAIESRLTRARHQLELLLRQKLETAPQ